MTVTTVTAGGVIAKCSDTNSTFKDSENQHSDKRAAYWYGVVLFAPPVRMEPDL